MVETLTDILTPPPIMGVTINNVFLHPVVRNVLYAVMAVSCIAGFVVFFRRTSFGTAARKAVILSFFLTGILAALYADIGWSVWVMRDYDELSGLSPDGKLMRTEGQLADFTRRARDVMHDSYELYATQRNPTDVYISWRTQYDLLPLRLRDSAPYIIVIEDPEAHYDPATRTFRRGDKTVRDAELVLNYAPQVYVLRGPR